MPLCYRPPLGSMLPSPTSSPQVRMARLYCTLPSNRQCNLAVVATTMGRNVPHRMPHSVDSLQYRQIQPVLELCTREAYDSLQEQREKTRKQNKRYEKRLSKRVGLLCKIAPSWHSRSPPPPPHKLQAAEC